MDGLTKSTAECVRSSNLSNQFFRQAKNKWRIEFLPISFGKLKIKVTLKKEKYEEYHNIIPFVFILHNALQMKNSLQKNLLQENMACMTYTFNGAKVQENTILQFVSGSQTLLMIHERIRLFIYSQHN